MQKADIFFSLLSGFSVAWLANHLFSLNYLWVLYFIFPLLSFICLFFAEQLGKRALFIFQAAKFFLIGTLATVIDLFFFEAWLWLFSLLPIASGLMFPKIISFIIATLIKFFGNKFWAFQKKDHIRKEFVFFLLMTFIGLLIDVSAFYWLTKVSGPLFGIENVLWIQISVVIAALASAIWSFCSYKFFVFKK